MQGADSGGGWFMGFASNAAERSSGVLRWWPVLPVGAAVAVLTFVLQRLIIFGYALVLLLLGGDAAVGQRLDRFAALMGYWGTPALHVLLTLVAAFWLAHALTEAPSRTGLAVGLTAAGFGQLIVLAIFPPITPAEAVQYLVLGAASGWLGGTLARSSLATRESLYRASRDIGAAQSALEVLSAVGEHLAPPGAREVSFWEVASRGENGDPKEFVLRKAWTSKHPGGETAGSCLGTVRMPAPPGLRRGSVLTLRSTELSAPQCAAWEKERVRCALLVPLLAPGGRWVGLLAIASGRLRFSRGTVRAYLTAGAQAALALENLRLIEEARRAGREAGVLRERERLAREIHDTLAQGFTSIVMNAQAAERAFPDSPEAVRHHHEQIARTARESLTEARRLVWALRPKTLEEASLSEALAALARRWSAESGVAATASVAGTPFALPEEIEATLLRVAQEALANVRKHARASRAALTLSYMGGRVALDVRDDGVGFDPPRAEGKLRDEASGGFGLEAMRQRAEGAGGTLVVESAPGEGTTLVVELPAESDKTTNGDEEALLRKAVE
jgi:signal transduction histidine kinase